MNEVFFIDLNNADKLFDLLLRVSLHLFHDDWGEVIGAFVEFGVFVLILDVAGIYLIKFFEVDPFWIIDLRRGATHITILFNNYFYLI